MAAGNSVSELASETDGPSFPSWSPLYFTFVHRVSINFTCASFSNFTKPRLWETIKLRLVTLPPTGIRGAV